MAYVISLAIGGRSKGKRNQKRGYKLMTETKKLTLPLSGIVLLLISGVVLLSTCNEESAVRSEAKGPRGVDTVLSHSICFKVVPISRLRDPPGQAPL
jgi:hypothetical protein